jgi:uncharacterized membrane protein YhaH (DUF805 family)
MTFVASIKEFWLKYATFRGRTSRRTYWWSILFMALATVLLERIFPGTTIISTNAIGHTQSYIINSVPVNIWLIAGAIPTFAVGARRLHDSGKSGGRLCWLLLPLIGPLLLLVWLTQPSDPNANRYGEPPTK